MLSWRKTNTTDASPCSNTTRKPTTIFQPTNIHDIENNKNEDEDTHFATSEATTSSSHRKKSFSGYPSMSTGSLRSILPKTPSPICSDDEEHWFPEEHSAIDSEAAESSESDVFYSEVATEVSSQSICSKSGTRKLSSRICSKHVPENVTYQPETETMKKHVDLRSCMADSSIYESTFETDQGDPGTKLDPDEVKTDHSSRDHTVSVDKESSVDSRHKLMRRPKPYQEFLNEVNKQEMEAQLDKRNKAKQMKLMDELRRKEDAISEWEQKQTTKAMKAMKKLEDKLERKRAEALKVTQEKITNINQVGRKKKATAKRKAGKTRIRWKILGIKNWFYKFCC